MEQKQLGRGYSSSQDFCVNRATCQIICAPAEKYRIIYKVFLEIFLRCDIIKL